MSEKIKRCNKCGYSSLDLKWDKELYAKEGIWKLAIITNDNGVITKIPHVCKEGVGTMNERPLSTYSQPLIKCQYCSESYGWFANNDDYIKHMLTYHPNNERLTDNDFKINKT